MKSIKHIGLISVLVLAVAVIIVGCEKPPAEKATAEKAPAEKPAETAKGDEGTQTVCPLMDGKIVKTVFADHDGKRVYFCCPGCIAGFKKDPAKIIKDLEAKGIVLAKTPAGAPAEKPGKAPASK